METNYVSGLGLSNRYELLFTDESIDPLDITKKTTKNKKRNKPKQTKSDVVEMKQTKSEVVEIKPKEPEKDIKTNIEAKVLNKPIMKPATDKAAEKEKSAPELSCRELSLDEYKEETAQRRTCKKPHLRLRQPGEGEDQSQWMKLVPLKNKKGEKKVEDVAVLEETSQRVDRVKHLPVEVTFGDSFARRLRRHGPSWHGSYSETLQPLVRQLPPRVDNEQEFPALGQ